LTPAADAKEHHGTSLPAIPYLVSSEDTVDKLSLRFKISAATLYSLNHLLGGELLPGKVGFGDVGKKKSFLPKLSRLPTCLMYV
jgi:hypothetical protein